MADFDMSDESAEAFTQLASVIEKIAPGNGIRDELTVAINNLIENRIADAVETMADRIEQASGIRP